MASHHVFVLRVQAQVVELTGVKTYDGGGEENLKESKAEVEQLDQQRRAFVTAKVERHVRWHGSDVLKIGKVQESVRCTSLVDDKCQQQPEDD